MMAGSSTWTPAVAGTIAAAALMAAFGCAKPTEPSVSGACIAPEHQLVYVEGTVYAASGQLPVGFAPGAAYAQVQKLQGCEDVIFVDENGNYESPDNTLDEGDSNYLPAGTRLYVIPGVDPADALAARADGEWWHRVVRFNG